MLRQASRHDENRIDANVISGPGIAHRETLGSNRNTPQAVAIERQGGCLVRAARLDLDEGDDTPPARDEIDLATGNAGTGRKNAPAVKPQPPCRNRLRPAAATLRLGAVASQSALRSSARA